MLWQGLSIEETGQWSVSAKYAGDHRQQPIRNRFEIDVLQEYISMLPNVDHPETFGQHPNADIASQIIETR